MTNDAEDPRPLASPPCMAAEINPAYSGLIAEGPVQPDDLAGWRRAERRRLRAARDAMTVAARQVAGAAIAGHLAALLRRQFGDLRGRVLSGYWPIKAEPDLRPLLAALDGEGVLVALPLVETKAAPLVFRRWTSATRMVRGDWNIPVPPPEAEVVTPEIALAPVVGWTDGGFRLGYGGGYFDRTLAALSPRPFTIGIGIQSACLATIHPQPHDIPLDAIVTEAGLVVAPR
jgi:5-formyltetrahydrofolate cyclo-ligase